MLKKKKSASEPLKKRKRKKKKRGGEKVSHENIWKKGVQREMQCQGSEIGVSLSVHRAARRFLRLWV